MRSYRLVFTLVVTIAAVVASALVICAQPASATPVSAVGPLHAQGSQLVDQYGRTILLHGVNNVDKGDHRGPLIVPGNGYTLTDAMAGTLAHHGINSVRLGVLFSGLMPTKGHIDTDYLDRIAAQVDMLASHGIRTLLDNHQDGLGSPWGGNGFPAWAIRARPAAGEWNPGFPLNSAVMPSLNAGWDEVWNNTYDTQDYLAQSLAALANRVKGHAGVQGIELINEPWPGSAYLTCFPIGCAAFDRKYQATLTKWTNAIRAKFPSVPVYWEPNVTWNETIPTYLGFSRPIPPSVVFSPHDYCIPSQLAIYMGLPSALAGACPLQQNKAWGNIDAMTARTHIPTVVTEFGDNDASVLSNTTDAADRRFTSWQYWPPFANTYPFESGAVADAVVRTYPQATAGTPQRMKYDTANGDFAYRYAPRPAARPTEIYVSDIKYPNGYTVNVIGGIVTSAPKARIVTIHASGSAPVTVKINRPRSAGITLPDGNDDGSLGSSDSSGDGSLGAMSSSSGSESGSSSGSTALGSVAGVLGS